MDKSLSRRKLALLALFFLPGISLASWVSRTPAIRDALGASTAQMGMVLLALSLGSMSGILMSGKLVARFGARAVLASGAIGLLIALPIIGFGSPLGSMTVVSIGLCLFGLCMGGAEVAINVEGAEVERLTGRSFLPVMHGGFSLGTVVGALIGVPAAAFNMPVELHLGAVTLFNLLVALTVLRFVPAGTGKMSDKPEGSSLPLGALVRDPRLLMISGIVLAMALAEGTANDWLPLLMVDGHGFSASAGSAMFALFAIAMTIMRFFSSPFIARFGRARILAISAVMGSLGLLLIMLVDNQVTAAIAVGLWGLGAALGFPIALSAAGDSERDPAARVAFVAAIGYFAFLVGPPVLGFVGEEWGLRSALLFPLVLLVASLFLTPATRERRIGNPAQSSP